MYAYRMCLTIIIKKKKLDLERERMWEELDVVVGSIEIMKI